MTFYIAREASKLWRRFSMETSIELKLLAEKWKLLLAGLIFQYIHGLAARGVHYLHRPGPTLQDVGFFLLPELGQDKAYISETASQILRIITFYSTQLPGPNYHCREKYGTRRCVKQLAWFFAVVQSLLIIASRKHYTVDIVVAWYTVNLVVFFIDKKLPELPDRSNGNGTSSPLLPLSTREKDSKTKEEQHKLLNGNSGDTADWRQRTQVNGKIVENGNAVHAEKVMNGT